jgi:DNA-binding SARP family transcriptional activator
MGDECLIRVLGPVDLVTAQGEVAVGGRQIRAALGTLVVALGHAVPADHLVAVLWGDEPPASALSSLHSYVSRLRHMLGAGTIHREDDTYALVIDPALVDAYRFERLIVEASEADVTPQQRRDKGQEALQMWRGIPFGDLAEEDPFRLEALRLDELRMHAMELRLDADISLGHAGLVVGLLESAVEEYPYRERLWLLLIEALARDGRRVESLRTADRLRHVLGDVGLEPGAALLALEEEIHRGSLESA